MLCNAIRLSRLLTGTSTALFDASYTYDGNGNIVNIAHPTGTAFGTVRYTYDALNRLIAASAAIASTTPQQDFTYDKLGSMLSLSDEMIAASSTESVIPSIMDSLPLSLRSITGNGTSYSASYTVPSGGASKVMIAIIGTNDGHTPILTQNGESFTMTAFSGTQGRATHWYGYLVNPSSGTFSFTYDVSDPPYNRADFVIFTVQDAAQSSPIDVTNITNEGSQSSNSTSVTTTVGKDLLISLPKWVTANWSSYGASESEYLAPVSSEFGMTAGSRKAAATTAGVETMTINLSASADVDEPVIAIRPAGEDVFSSTITEAYIYAGTDYANPHAVTQIGNGVSTTTFAYDNNGNLVQKIARSGGNATTTLHTWDYANRLLQTAIGNTSTTTTSYGYDAFGSRVFMGTGGATTTYPSKYFSRIFSTTGATTTATTTSYLFSADTLLAIFEGGQYGTTTSYMHGDHLGSTNVVTNASGTVVQVLDYYPFGAKRIDSGSQTTDRQFIGQRYDSSVDLNYLNARYYSSGRGQFISQDPIFTGDPRRQNLANPQSLNSYSYAENNPIVKKDPDGLAAKSSEVATQAKIAEIRKQIGAIQTKINQIAASMQRTGSQFYGGIWNPISGGSATMNNSLPWYERTSAGVGTGIGIVGSIFAPEARIAGTARIGATGKVGEAALETLVGGESQVPFLTSQGMRVVDQFSGAVAHEAKTGYQSLTTRNAAQIAKDAALIADPMSGVVSATWHFFQSPVTGLGGPSGPLGNALIKAGINYILH